MTRRAANLDLLEPEAIAGLNRRDMARLGVAPGDWIKVATRRGEVTLKARQDRDVLLAWCSYRSVLPKRQPTC